MMSSSRPVFLAIALLAAVTTCHGQNLMAKFHMEGTLGTATFTMNGGVNTVQVSLNIGEALGSTSVHIRPLWVNYDVADKCSTAQLGANREGMSQTLTINQNQDINFSLNVPSLDSLEGNSIVLVATSKTLCATIQQEGDFITAVAHLQNTVLGNVYFRQHNSTDAITRVVTDLFTQIDANTAMWMVSDSAQSCDQLEKGSMYNPNDTSGDQCGMAMHSMCAVGNLTGKLGDVPLAGMRGGMRSAFTDRKLPLIGDHSINNKLLLVYPGNGGQVTCARIRVFSGRMAKVNFDHDGVTGFLTFKQASPLDKTYVSVDLKGLQNKAKGYHVHLWPTPQKIEAGQMLCSGAVVSGHFNPFNISTSSPSYPNPEAGTDDQYEVGDLSGKHGVLANMDIVTKEYEDMNLPLYGTNTIIGRSIVIHHDDASSSRWICANIEPQYPVISAVAVFKYPVIGHAMFMQHMDNPEAETSIFVELDYNDGRAGTLGHEWMVNSKPDEDEMMCQSTGATYNPQDLSSTLSNRQYREFCNNNRPFGCKIGDLSGKVGTVDIRNGATATKAFFSDVNLPLSGRYSVVGKSLVVIGTVGIDILSCAQIQPVHDTQLAAKFNMNGITGKVMFTQKAAGFGAKSTMVNFDIKGLPAGHSFKIMDVPPAGNDCNVGALYNPLNIQNPPGGDTGTDDMYPIGDLHRYGVMESWTSNNLPLTGINSIWGRSLVLVDVSRTSVACAKIEPYLSDGSTQLVIAMVNFTGEVMGHVQLSQVLYDDGTMSDTSILINLKYDNDTKTMDHNWHTHVKPVYGDTDAVTGRCSSAGPHFDPFNCMNDNAANYAAECKPSNPLRCELGDQAKKVGTYDVGSGNKVFTDVYMPLIGKYTVLGRSIVLHVANKGPGRQACGNIIPVTSNPVEVVFATPKNMDLLDASNTFAKVIRAEQANVVVQLLNTDSERTTINVHFVGLQKDKMRDRFVQYIGNSENSNSLGIYTPFINAASFTALSSTLLVLLLALQLSSNLL